MQIPNSLSGSTNRITIVPSWRHLVNDIDLCRSLKSPKNP